MSLTVLKTFLQLFAVEVFRSILGQVLTPFLTHQSKSQFGASQERMQHGVFLKSSGAGQLDKLGGSLERMQQGVSLKSSRAREQDHI